MYGLNNNSAPSLILVKTALDKLISGAGKDYAYVGKAEATDELIFSQGTATNAAVVTTVEGGGGYFEKQLNDLGPNRNITVSAPAPKTTVIAAFKKDLPISRTFMADQQQQAVSRAVTDQGMTWYATRDRNAFAIYANGFTTVTTIDGATLFSNTHTNQNGDIVDNLETGVLNNDNVNILCNSLRTQISQTGVILGYEPKFLLTSSILHMTGCAVTKSVLRAGTGNNDQNYFSEYYPGLKVKYSPFLDSVSTTAYFVGSSNHGVWRFAREAFFTELVDWKYTENTDSYKYKMRAREEVDAIEYSGLVGSNGTV